MSIWQGNEREGLHLRPELRAQSRNHTMVKIPHIRKILYKLGTIINIKSQRNNKRGCQGQHDTP